MSFFFRCVRGTTSAPDSESQPAASFGLATLLDLFEHDHDAVVRLLRAAIAAIDRDMAAIERSATADDRFTIVEAAHRIKGTSGSIGAGNLIEISSRIEATMTRTCAGVGTDVLGELREAVRAVRDDIAAYECASRPG